MTAMKSQKYSHDFAWLWLFMHDATQGNIFPQLQQNRRNIPTILPGWLVVCKHDANHTEIFTQLQRNRGNIPTICWLLKIRLKYLVL